MTLSSRLSRLQAEAGSRPAVVTRPAAATIQSRLAHLRPERLQGQSHPTPQRISFEELVQAVNGERITDGLIKIEEQIPLSGTLGNRSLDGLVEMPLLPGEVSPAPSLYIDTETTGLSGGSGTLAFLVGVAELKETHIQLTQFLITSFTAEYALLSNLNTILSREQRLVSYNGKSYDLPLLATRYRMQGIKHSLEEIDHLDLLHPIRRLYAKRWEDCRLTTVERRMLGFHRKDDLPGSEAPEAWFSWLQRGEGERIIKIIKHNRQDILSLAVIHHATAQAIQQPAQWGVDLYGLGRWLMDTNEAYALRLLGSHRERLCDDGKRLLGYLFRRAENWHEAVPLWEELAMRDCVDSLERLAKYHEHISKDLYRALHYSERLPGSSLDIHRQERIKEKIGKHIQQDILSEFLPIEY